MIDKPVDDGFRLDFRQTRPAGDVFDDVRFCHDSKRLDPTSDEHGKASFANGL